MSDNSVVEKIRANRRYIAKAKAGDEDLGPLKHLPGTWSNKPDLEGRGWNIIALPFADGRFNYRVLMNQYNEELKFSLVDKGVPNRGIKLPDGSRQTDQFVVTLDYQQSIEQIAAADFPESGDAGDPGLPIHHEPGLFLHMLNEQTNDLDIARLATIPHGDSALALGRSEKVRELAPIPGPISALPIGVSDDLDRNPYLEPYKHFVDTPFKGVLSGAPDFPGFLPNDTTALLQLANQDLGGFEVKRTTILDLDTTLEDAGVVNIPFIVKQANAASMKSTFWIQELRKGRGRDKVTKLRMQYVQVVMLDFFRPRRDGMPGPIRWPHISINTMEKVSDSTD
ncbi:MAG: heme-binding protein [Pseudomonadota bacterium]